MPVSKNVARMTKYSNIFTRIGPAQILVNQDVNRIVVDLQLS